MNSVFEKQMFASNHAHYMKKKVLNICSNPINLLFTTERVIWLRGSNQMRIIMALAIFYVS